MQTYLSPSIHLYCLSNSFVSKNRVTLLGNLLTLRSILDYNKNEIGVFVCEYQAANYQVKTTHNHNIWTLPSFSTWHWGPVHLATLVVQMVTLL